MDETHNTFHDKWHQSPTLAFESTLKEGTEVQNWILRRNGFGSLAELRDFLKGIRRMLDGGCGNGRVTALLASNAPADSEIVGIDFSSIDAASVNLKPYPNVTLFERDLLSDLGDIGKFDFIYCQEVLHHTKNPSKAFANLAALLAPNGEFAIYVYKLKAPIREFADDFIRDKVQGMPFEQSMQTFRAITDIGRRLSNLKQTIEVADIEVLGIKAGEYDVQRFFYHFFMKCFWSNELSYEDNAMINFDWYRPQLATRHTVEEVRGWFEDARLSVVHEYVDEYGITMRGVRT